MEIAKTTDITSKTFQGVSFEQKSEIIILIDCSGNYFIKKSGKLIRMSRKDAQKFFQENFKEFWKYLALNKLHEQFPDLYTKEETWEIKKSYNDTSKNMNIKRKFDDHYAALFMTS